ncbi:hypothetical protein LINGRAHAP2_LOCUS17611 [Linum grandiflorum]
MAELQTLNEDTKILPTAARNAPMVEIDRIQSDTVAVGRAAWRKASISNRAISRFHKPRFEMLAFSRDSVGAELEVIDTSPWLSLKNVVTKQEAGEKDKQ